MLAAAALALGLGACGSGTRQDANEPNGTFKVAVVHASFPGGQKLAKTSGLVIAVKNTGSKTIPDIAVTVAGFDRREADPRLADPSRPVFVINGVGKRLGGSPEAKEAAPAGCETAYVGTWACGRLRPGHTRTFKWTVTAVKAGPYRIRYVVSAGLHGKSKAVDASGRRPHGQFAGTISNAAPNVRVADDGKIVKGRAGP